MLIFLPIVILAGIIAIEEWPRGGRPHGGGLLPHYAVGLWSLFGGSRVYTAADRGVYRRGRVVVATWRGAEWKRVPRWWCLLTRAQILRRIDG